MCEVHKGGKLKLWFSSWKSKIYDDRVQNAKIEVQNFKTTSPEKHKNHKPTSLRLKNQNCLSQKHINHKLEIHELKTQDC